MKRLVIGVSIAVGVLFGTPGRSYAADCTWARVTGASRSVVASGAEDCTFTVASRGATDGLNLNAVGAISVKICAASGQTITTKFAVKAYSFDPWYLDWIRDPDWDLSNPNGETGAQCQVVGTWTVSGPIGRIAFVPSAGAVSSGNITIRIIASGVNGERL